MNIVFLDAATLNFGDMDMGPIAACGDYREHGLTAAHETAARLAGAEVAITNKVVIDRAVLDACPALRFVAVAATGYNVVDVDAARERGIGVANVPGYSTESVAQLAMAFILALSTRLMEHDRAARGGAWGRSPMYTMGDWPWRELAGATVGIMGLGAIGARVAELCRAFGMRIVALGREGVSYNGTVERVGLDELAARSEYVSIHMPLTDYSRRLADARFLGMMKPTAYLVNLARGPIVDAHALAEALRAGRIAGAAVDVRDVEPPPADDPLLGAPNLIATPHVAWASVEARRRLIAEIAANIRAYRDGAPRNIVNS
ncbi:MAG TPA: D-2-hydroxyacid dehydrogenase [Spirochaetota bacterium]|nr:D-2-hydroxyacid dehydrogenase [Spirochaetota bacterium]HNT11837.1 D-2-hydroxyacid dehydrogenase [Spirochaetota bacterium]HOS38540.1 D-2-hydroxyacid dehydrogenase [Spirochaetota bacterium]